MTDPYRRRETFAEISDKALAEFLSEDPAVARFLAPRRARPELRVLVAEYVESCAREVDEFSRRRNRAAMQQAFTVVDETMGEGEV